MSIFPPPGPPGLGQLGPPPMMGPGPMGPPMGPPGMMGGPPGMPPAMMLLQVLQQQAAMQRSRNPAAWQGMQPPARPMNFRDHLRQQLEGLPPPMVEHLVNLSTLGGLAPWATP